jgi:hypothetical protein
MDDIYSALLAEVRDRIPVRTWELLVEIKNWVIGPRKYLPCGEYITPHWRVPLPHPALYAGWVPLMNPVGEVDYPLYPNFIDNPLPAVSVQLYAADFDSWVAYIGQLAPWAISRRGAMMGDPIAWPGLPIMTLFTWESVVPPERHYEIMTTGDDALFQVTREESKEFTTRMVEQDTVISIGKDFLHKAYGLYTEEVLREGEVEPFLAFAPLVGPPGGSKGESDWYSAPGSQQALANQRQYQGLIPWSQSRFHASWLAARKLGIPVHLPPRWGGINLPIKRGKWKDGLLRVKWAAYVAGRSNRDIVLKGTGLYFGEGGFKFDPVAALAARHHFTLVLNATTSALNNGGMGARADYDASPIDSVEIYREVVDRQSTDRKAFGALVEVLRQGSLKQFSNSFDKLLVEHKEFAKPNWVAKRDIKTRLAIPYQLEKLLEGERPPSGKTPSIFKMASFLHRRLGRIPPRGRLQSDINLVLLKESYLDTRVDLGMLGDVRFTGLPKLLPSRREQKRAADVRTTIVLIFLRSPRKTGRR